MPHYRNGEEAKVGDLVRGRGYNVKHEIMGRVVQLTIGAEACNIQVAHVGADTPIYLTSGAYPQVKVEANIEYGQADAFEKVPLDG